MASIFKPALMRTLPNRVWIISHKFQRDVSYPNIFQFVVVLKNIQTDICMQMPSSNITSRRKEGVEKYDFIRKYYDSVRNQKIYHDLSSLKNSAHKNLPVL